MTSLILVALCSRQLAFFSCLSGQYPTQPTYPVQPPGNPVYPQTLHLPQAPPYTDAPPAYSELYRPSFVHPGAATVPTMSAAFPGASLYLPMAQSVAVGPLGSTIPMAYYPVSPIYPPGSTVLVEGGYDAGARFGAGATAGNIPVKEDQDHDREQGEEDHGDNNLERRGKM
uniref:DAZ-associated protein 2 n=1 Tax=Piliocolobus tephrosceles TaxID=591936 RepID=A0A8C9G9L4_9PRIM